MDVSLNNVLLDELNFFGDIGVLNSIFTDKNYRLLTCTAIRRLWIFYVPRDH